MRVVNATSFEMVSIMSWHSNRSTTNDLIGLGCDPASPVLWKIAICVCHAAVWLWLARGHSRRDGPAHSSMCASLEGVTGLPLLFPVLAASSVTR